MLPVGQFSDVVGRAFTKAMSDPLIAEAVVTTLEDRCAYLANQLNIAARAALVDPDKARAGALILEGQLREATSWLERANRFVDKGTLDVARPVKPSTHRVQL